MTTPNDNNQNSELPSYSDIAGSGSGATADLPYSEAAAYNSGNTIPGKKNPLAPWALGAGILTLVAVVSFFFTGFAFIPGIVGIILSTIALVQGKKYAPQDSRKVLSIIGLVLSIIGTLISIVAIIMAMALFGDCLTYSDPVQQQQCFQDKLGGS